MNDIKKISIIIIMFGFIFIALFFILFVLESSNNKNSNINQVALVYRYMNYSWKKTDYLCILTEDGSVYYENLIENAEKYDDLSEDSLSLVLSVFGDISNIKYQVKPFTNEFKDELYSRDYENVSLKSGDSSIIDGGDKYYYCLVLSQSEYNLVKIGHYGYKTSVSEDNKLTQICKYIDTIIKKI